MSQKMKIQRSCGVRMGAGAVLAPCILMLAAPAMAQSGRGLEEIIVTANKREQSMQDVPIAISAITADIAGKLGVVDAQNLAMVVPGLRLDRQTNGIIPFLRGVGSPSTQLGNEPSVAMFVDGVYYNNSNVMLAQYNNIQSIEVLKGPQGTLFGRNATGGVIHVKTKDPTPEPQLDIKVGYGNYDTISGAVYASGGLSETLSANLAIYSEDQRDGWGKNYTTGSDTYLQDAKGGRVKLLWEPSEKTSVLLNLDYDDYFNQQAVYFRPAPGTLSNAGPLSAPPSDPYDTFENLDPIASSEQWGGSIKISHDFPTMRVVSITALRDSESEQYFAQDGMPIARLNVDLIYEIETFTQELQIQSLDDSKVQWVAGIFWYDDRSQVTNFQFEGLLTGGGNNRKGALADIESESFSAFAQATIPVTEQMNVTLGLRRTTDDRQMFGGRRNVDANGNTFFTPANNNGHEDSWSSWSGKIALDYQFSDDFMAYVAYNRGFKSGAYNSIIAPDFLNVVPGTTGNNIDPPVDPETLDAYTIGFKSEFFDNMLRINAEAFFYDYTNLQLQQVLLIPGGGTATRISNAAEAEIKGLEVDITAVPTDNLTITAALQLQDGEYKDYPNGQFFVYNANGPGGNCAFVAGNASNCLAVPPNYDPLTGNWNLKGNETINTPSYSLSLTGSYAIPTNIGEFDLTLMWSHTDEYFFDADNGLGQIAPSSQKNNMQDKLDIINGSISWTSLDGKYNLSLWGKNLTDELYISFANQTGTVTKNIYGPPRTYGVTFMAKLF
ncbi:MAG: TonB-dependent receptor [Porticoccaceae bacterium]